MGNPILRSHGTVAHQARITWNFHKTLDMIGFINAASANEDLSLLFFPLPDFFILLPPVQSHFDTALLVSFRWFFRNRRNRTVVDH